MQSQVLEGSRPAHCQMPFPKAAHGGKDATLFPLKREPTGFTGCSQWKLMSSDYSTVLEIRVSSLQPEVDCWSFDRVHQRTPICSPSHQTSAEDPDQLPPSKSSSQFPAQYALICDHELSQPLTSTVEKLLLTALHDGNRQRLVDEANIIVHLDFMFHALSPRYPLDSQCSPSLLAAATTVQTYPCNPCCTPLESARGSC